MVPFLSRFLCVKEGEEGVVVLLVAAFLRSKRNAGVIFSVELSCLTAITAQSVGFCDVSERNG